MPEIRADGVAIYVYRRLEGRTEFLQLRRVGEGDPYAQTWQTVYGTVEAGETAVQAAIRELDEETSLTPLAMWQVEYLEQFYFLEKDYVYVMPVFAVEAAAEATPVLDREHDAFRWIPERQIDVAFIWKSQREAVAAVLEMLRKPPPAAAFLKIPL